MWSLGCVVVEMHTGEPLFGGANQVDQICRIVDIMGMPPLSMIKASPDKVKHQFFEKVQKGEEANISSICDLNCTVFDAEENVTYVLKRPNRDLPKPRSLSDIIGVYIGGPSKRRLGEPNHSPEHYEEFLDFIMSVYHCRLFSVLFLTSIYFLGNYWSMIQKHDLHQLI
jgi:dual specificity tyrosine-phosphorylation-regulated kinase 1